MPDSGWNIKPVSSTQVVAFGHKPQWQSYPSVNKYKIQSSTYEFEHKKWLKTLWPGSVKESAKAS